MWPCQLHVKHLKLVCYSLFFTLLRLKHSNQFTRLIQENIAMRQTWLLQTFKSRFIKSRGHYIDCLNDSLSVVLIHEIH